MIAYAGIGSRETPDHVKGVMFKIAKMLALKGMILRSGAAPGADTAFEQGCDEVGGKKEIYIPTRGFMGNTSNLYGLEKDDEAEEIAMQFHPNWEACNDNVRRLHTRNVYQVLGRDLKSPSDFVVCWTENGELKGGTAQALRIAEYYWIPIFNLGKPGTLDKFREFFKLNFMI